jgi:hypothetical protein
MARMRHDDSSSLNHNLKCYKGCWAGAVPPPNYSYSRRPFFSGSPSSVSSATDAEPRLESKHFLLASAPRLRRTLSARRRRARAYTQRISTTPWRAAKTSACSLECTSSLARMLAMWLRSVSTLM